jgi:hypothetical protein
VNLNKSQIQTDDETHDGTGDTTAISEAADVVSQTIPLITINDLVALLS